MSSSTEAQSLLRTARVDVLVLTKELTLNIKTKLLIAATVPAIIIALASFWLIQSQTEALANVQIEDVKTNTLNARKAELQKMTQLALNSIQSLHEDTALPEGTAQARAKRILQDMAFGEDGYFFVYDGKGTNLVHPRLPNLVGENWWNLQDPNGDFVIRNLIKAAKAGGGFHNYVWNKPSTGALAPKIGHAVFLEKWDWMIGTGLYVDDLDAEIAAMKTALQTSIDRTKGILIILTLASILLAALIAWFIRLSEQRFADERLRQLTHRVVEVQEDERMRVSKELHDGISQLLVSARYGLDLAMNRTKPNAKANAPLKKSMGTIETAINEVRRISMALRPSVLDDIGLAEAISSLSREFGDQLSIKMNIKTNKVGTRISKKAQTALYRVAQESLTNIAKHSNATNVSVQLSNNRHSVQLVIIDDGLFENGSVLVEGSGRKANLNKFGTGMGLRNMRERMDAFDGTLEVSAAATGGLKIIAILPIQREWTEPTNDNETIKGSDFDAA